MRKAWNRGYHGKGKEHPEETTGLPLRLTLPRPQGFQVTLQHTAGE